MKSTPIVEPKETTERGADMNRNYNKIGSKTTIKRRGERPTSVSHRSEIYSVSTVTIGLNIKGETEIVT